MSSVLRASTLLDGGSVSVMDTPLPDASSDSARHRLWVPVSRRVEGDMPIHLCYATILSALAAPTSPALPRGIVFPQTLVYGTSTCTWYKRDAVSGRIETEAPNRTTTLRILEAFHVPHDLANGSGPQMTSSPRRHMPALSNPLSSCLEIVATWLTEVRDQLGAVTIVQYLTAQDLSALLWNPSGMRPGVLQECHRFGGRPAASSSAMDASPTYLVAMCDNQGATIMSFEEQTANKVAIGRSGKPHRTHSPKGSTATTARPPTVPTAPSLLQQMHGALPVVSLHGPAAASWLLDGEAKLNSEFGAIDTLERLGHCRPLPASGWTSDWERQAHETAEVVRQALRRCEFIGMPEGDATEQEAATADCSIVLWLAAAPPTQSPLNQHFDKCDAVTDVASAGAAVAAATPRASAARGAPAADGFDINAVLLGERSAADVSPATRGAPPLTLLGVVSLACTALGIAFDGLNLCTAIGERPPSSASAVNAPSTSLAPPAPVDQSPRTHATQPAASCLESLAAPSPSGLVTTSEPNRGASLANGGASSDMSPMRGGMLHHRGPDGGFVCPNCGSALSSESSGKVPLKQVVAIAERAQRLARRQLEQLVPPSVPPLPLRCPNGRTVLRSRPTSARHVRSEDVLSAVADDAPCFQDGSSWAPLPPVLERLNIPLRELKHRDVWLARCVTLCADCCMFFGAFTPSGRVAAMTAANLPRAKAVGGAEDLGGPRLAKVGIDDCGAVVVTKDAVAGGAPACCRSEVIDSIVLSDLQGEHRHARRQEREKYEMRLALLEAARQRDMKAAEGDDEATLDRLLCDIVSKSLAASATDVPYSVALMTQLYAAMCQATQHPYDPDLGVVDMKPPASVLHAASSSTNPRMGRRMQPQKRSHLPGLDYRMEASAESYLDATREDELDATSKGDAPSAAAASYFQFIMPPLDLPGTSRQLHTPSPTSAATPTRTLDERYRAIHRMLPSSSTGVVIPAASLSSEGHHGPSTSASQSFGRCQLRYGSSTLPMLRDAELGLLVSLAGHVRLGGASSPADDDAGL